MKDVVACEKLRRAGKQALLSADIRMGKPTSFEVSIPEYIGYEKRTRRTETSKYPEEKTSTEIAQVVASERAAACTR